MHMRLIGCVLRVRGGRESDLGVGGVEDGVEALEESESIDEVQALAALGANVVDYEVNVAVRAANLRVEGTRPDLGIGCEFEGVASNVEEQALQAILTVDRQEACRLIERSTSSTLVCLERVSCEVDQCRPGVYDSRGGRENGGTGGSERYTLIDSPVFARRACTRDGHERDIARKLAAVRRSEVELSILVVRGRGCGDEGDTDKGSADGSLADKVVRDGWNIVGTADGPLGEVVGTDAENAVEAIETLRGRRDTD